MDAPQALRQAVRKVDLASCYTQSELVCALEALSDQVRLDLPPNFGLGICWNPVGSRVTQQETDQLAELLLRHQLGRIRRATDLDTAKLADLLLEIAEEVRERGCLIHAPFYWDHYHARRLNS